MADAIKEAVKDIKFYLDRINELTERNKELEAALQWIARHDLQAIALDALRPEERISMREKKDG